MASVHARAPRRDRRLSGHSKWHNIRLRKGKADAQRGARFTKLSREIILAAKGGSADPEANTRLKLAVEKARAANMPGENIKRAISRAQGTADAALEEIRYEGYGVEGVAIVVDAATDNRNRTAAELRFAFTRHQGSLAESGSVMWMFDVAGIIHVDARGQSEEALTERVLIDGVIDLRYGEVCEVITEPSTLAVVRDTLQRVGLTVTDAYLGVVPKTTVTPQGDALRQTLALLDALEEHEDVQRVSTNLEIDDATLETLAS